MRTQWTIEITKTAQGYSYQVQTVGGGQAPSKASLAQTIARLIDQYLPEHARENAPENDNGPVRPVETRMVG
jgi:hypothetical protein